MLKYIFKVFKEYNIIRNLRYFIIDNALNNNIIIIALSLALRRDFNLKYKPLHYRIRY